MAGLQSKSSITSSLLALAVLVSACAMQVPSESRVSESVLEEPDWDAIESALSNYPLTPFTLSLVGEAERPDGELKLDGEVATEVAYCRNYAKQGMQTRIGSDFWRQSLENNRLLEGHLESIVSDPAHVAWLTWQAEGMFMDAIDYARRGDAAAAMNFNFGGHAKACSDFVATLRESQ